MVIRLYNAVTLEENRAQTLVLAAFRPVGLQEKDDRRKEGISRQAYLCVECFKFNLLVDAKLVTFLL